MIKNNQINESLALELAFETLGNALGDYLLFLELRAIGSIEDTTYTKQIRQLLDCYSEQFDKILSDHRVRMASDLKKLIEALLVDLEKQMTTRRYS